MAINSVVLLANTKNLFVPQAQVLGQWASVGDATYLKIKDANPITNPAGQIVDGSRQAFTNGLRSATRLALRMEYSAPFTTTQVPSVRLFGAVTDGTASSGWHSVRNLAGALDLELGLDDALDLFETTTLRVTTPHETENVFDTQGYNLFLVGVEKLWLVSSGAPATATLSVRFW